MTTYRRVSEVILKILFGTFDQLLFGPFDQLFLITAVKLVRKFFCFVFFLQFLSVKIIHILEGSQHEVMDGRLVDNVFFFLKISPLTGGKPALPGNGREAG